MLLLCAVLREPEARQTQLVYNIMLLCVFFRCERVLKESRPIECWVVGLHVSIQHLFHCTKQSCELCGLQGGLVLRVAEPLDRVMRPNCAPS